MPMAGAKCCRRPDGGVLMQLEAPGAAASCRSLYPDGHAFSEADKKEAVAEYASRLGLARRQGRPAPACRHAAPAAPASMPSPSRMPTGSAKAGPKSRRTVAVTAAATSSPR